MSTCVFCAVVQRDAPGSILYEDDALLAFLDRYPVNRGHTLVVPKAHIADLSDCPTDLAARLFGLSARLAPLVVTATGAEGFNVWTANGRAAGQTIFHLHLHILPRFADDTFGLRFPKHYLRKASCADLDGLAEQIKLTEETGSSGSFFHG